MFFFLGSKRVLPDFSVHQAAIKNSHNTVHLLQRDVQVNHNAGIFITLNPATKGYGGRQKLPDNLKQLFRPVGNPQLGT